MTDLPKAVKQTVQIAVVEGLLMTVEAQVYGNLALYRFSKAFGGRPGPLDFSVAQVPSGIEIGYFRKAATAKEFIAYLLAEMSDAIVSRATMVAAGERILAAWRDYYRRDFKPYPIPEVK